MDYAFIDDTIKVAAVHPEIYNNIFLLNLICQVICKSWFEYFRILNECTMINYLYCKLISSITMMMIHESTDEEKSYVSTQKTNLD